MSAIGGVMRFDGQPIAPRDLERMANALRPYGPDRSNITVAGAIGLVNALMRMTPEDQFDQQPWRSASGMIITSDLRLDNRDDLLVKIGLAPNDAMTWADSRVLLVAFEKFGDDVWPMLRGPFAAAIWDPQRRVLTLARDHLGHNIVMWHKTHRFFAFSTMPKGLFAIQDVPRELNEEKFADFLVLNHADHATTFYNGVFRIAPAHVAKVSLGGSMVQHRYWSVGDIKSIRLGSDQAYADGLRECLDKAVRRQLRSAHPIGCHLTGGLDSSSVATLAARALGARNQRIMAFTQVPREGFNGQVPLGCYADETPYVEAIRSKVSNIDVTYIRNDESDDFADLEKIFLALEGPVRNPTNFGWAMAIARAARAQGRRVLLSGFEGNTSISWSGWPQAADHLRRGRFLTAYHQWRMFYRRSPYSRWTSFRKLFVEPLAPDVLGNWAARRRHPGRISPWHDHAAIRPEFASEMKVDARARAVGHDFLYRPRPDMRRSNPITIDCCGDCEAAEKAVHGVETRDPTSDVDVIAYCFGIPPEQYLAEDIDRSLVRRAMWGILPEIVLTNRLRGLQAADWYEKLSGQRDRLTAEITGFSTSALARRAIDCERLSRAIQNWPADGWHTREVIDEYQLAFARGIAAGQFLRWMDATNR
jgi:asparagine synthase (glutamine-hydrolysing)